MKKIIISIDEKKIDVRYEGTFTGPEVIYALKAVEYGLMIKDFKVRKNRKK